MGSQSRGTIPDLHATMKRCVNRDSIRSLQELGARLIKVHRGRQVEDPNAGLQVQALNSKSSALSMEPQEQTGMDGRAHLLFPPVSFISLNDFFWFPSLMMASWTPSTSCWSSCWEFQWNDIRIFYLPNLPWNSEETGFTWPWRRQLSYFEPVWMEMPVITFCKALELKLEVCTSVTSSPFKIRRCGAQIHKLMDCFSSALLCMCEIYFRFISFLRFFWYGARLFPRGRYQLGIMS